MAGSLIEEIFLIGIESNLTATVADYDSRDTCPVPGPTYLVPEFERNFRCSTTYKVAVTYKWVPFATIALYLVAIRAGMRFMEGRAKPFDLRAALGAWNAALAVFNIVASLRMVNVVELVYTKGLQYALLHDGYTVCKGFCLWPALFLLSKYVELGDTAFIVLRGRKVTFLHAYHHTTVLLFTFRMAVKASSGLAVQYMAINYFVHAFMYSYYACRAYGIKVPRPVAIAITCAQLVQMFYGAWVTVAAYQYTKHTGLAFEPKFALWIYGSYGVLFINFFVQSYFLKPRSRSVKVEKSPRKVPRSILKSEKLKFN